VTFGEIYSRAMWLVYGSSTPPVDADTQFQGVTEGILANLHRNLQEDFNYWFMEEAYGVAVPAYTRSLALPSDFKEECGVIRVLSFGDEYDTGSAECAATTAVTGTSTAWETDWSGRKHQLSWDDATWYPIEAVTSATALVLESAGPTQAAAAYTIRKCTGAIEIAKLYRGQEDRMAVQGSQRYPLYYSIYEGVMRLFPLPNEATYLEFKYYKFLDRPTVFVSHSDDLTINAADALVYYIAAFEEKRRQNWESAQMYEGMGDAQVQLLQNRNFSRSNSNMILPYIDY
jgi:hypothetical protein